MTDTELFFRRRRDSRSFNESPPDRVGIFYSVLRGNCLGLYPHLVSIISYVFHVREVDTRKCQKNSIKLEWTHLTRCDRHARPKPFV